jgi:hypothetical protein
MSEQNQEPWTEGAVSGFGEQLPGGGPLLPQDTPTDEGTPPPEPEPEPEPTPEASDE